MRMKLFVAVVINMVLVASACGSLIDANGKVTDWDLTPFSQPNQADVQGPTMWSTIQNGYSPINYPSGIGHVPSPGGTTGEKYDLEEMHVRLTDTAMQVLVVTSSPLTADSSGTTIYLGDLFIQADDAWFGVVTQDAGRGLAAGAIYRLNGCGDVVALQPGSQSYAGNNTLVENDYGPPATIRDIAGPWAVSGGIDPGQWLGTATLETATFDYGGAEDGTFLIQYTLDPALLGFEDPAILATKITWGCGNDVIRVQGVEAPHTPEPATIGMLLVGVALTYLGRRRTTA